MATPIPNQPVKDSRAEDVLKTIEYRLTKDLKQTIPALSNGGLYYLITSAVRQILTISNQVGGTGYGRYELNLHYISEEEAITRGTKLVRERILVQDPEVK